MAQQRTQAQSILEQHVGAVAGTHLTARGLLIALGVVVATALLGLLVDLGVRRFYRARGRARGVQSAFGRLARYVVYFLGLITSLSVAGFSPTALVAGSSALLVGIGFGIKNVTQNFVAGLIVLAEQPVRQGDFIRVNEVSGTVREVGLRASQIVTRDGSTLIVPNSKLVSEFVTNYSYPRARQRWTVAVHLSYGAAPDQVRELLEGVARDHPLVLEDPGPEARLEGLASYSLHFELLFWVADPVQSRRVASEIRYAVVEALREAGISLPVPQLQAIVATPAHPDRDTWPADPG